ncbi:hypothetical protein PTKIN_Ptkin16aG0528300 [Pterospermum kingtungense]
MLFLVCSSLEFLIYFPPDKINSPYTFVKEDFGWWKEIASAYNKLQEVISTSNFCSPLVLNSSNFTRLPIQIDRPKWCTQERSQQFKTPTSSSLYLLQRIREINKTNIMCDFVGPILEVIKFVGRPAKKYFNYHRKFKDYEEGFKQAKEDLQARERDIRRQLRDEERFGKEPKLEVERWFEKVEKKLGYALGVEDKVSKGKYLFRSCLGKLVDEETQAMKEVHAQGHFSGSLVVNDPSAATPMPVPELGGGYKAKEEIYKFLVGDEVRMVGVWGMGGIGKTTIMKHVYNRLLEENKFSKLIWTTVSQNFDIRKLQESIANQLKEKLSDDDLAIRAATLSGMLRRQRRYVLILDDVWSRFSLEEVGIPKPTADNGCKLVLTTRSKEVVQSMDCTEVKVLCLPRDEALQLFLSEVGQAMVVPNPTLESIVEECDGLPLAIVTVAGCMKGTSDPVFWENALNELRGHIRTFQDVKGKVFSCLQFSYDRLQQIDQDCFLYCALYPEDHEIPKEQIIENWMDEGLVEEMVTRKAMQSNGHSILKKLEENCLLERVGYGGTYIKMHDVVRDMALDITRKRFLVKAGNEKLPSEEEWTEDLEKVSLMCNYVSTIPPNMRFPNFEHLTTLLFTYNRLENIPESFFNHMPNLKILDLSGNERITMLPESIFNLEKLTALSLYGCEKLHYLPSLLKLKALKKLDLGKTSIKEIPQGLEMLVNLRYLNLGDTHYLKEIPNGLLSKLCRLQHLVIHPASTRAEEMRELNKLEVFEGRFSNVRDFIKFAGQRKKLHQYWIWVGQDDEYDNYLEVQVKLLLNKYVRYNGRRDYSKWVALDEIDMNKIGDGIMLACDIQQLYLCLCKGVRSLNDISGWEDLTDLKECLVNQCYEVESIFPSKCRQLETLEYLYLVSLYNLKGIVGVSSVATFSSLKIIRLYRCGTIKNLFSAKWVMPNLERICVEYCKEMEEIIVSEEAETIKFQYILPKLRDLVLLDLPKLKNICNENGVMVCDSLQILKIERCEKLKRIPLYLDPDKEEPSLPPLKKIQVDPKEWWASVKFDHPLAKNVLQPIQYFYDQNTCRWEPAV